MMEMNNMKVNRERRVNYETIITENSFDLGVSN